VFHMFDDRARAVALMLLLPLLAGGLGGCASTPAARPTVAAASGPVASQAASAALEQLGIPYRYGGADRSGFDCSGLIYYSYANAGKAVARTTGGLWQTLEPISANKLQVGDVLFFNIEGKMSHVGMYIGERRFVHSPATGRTVSIESLDSDFYRLAFIRGGRAR